MKLYKVPIEFEMYVLAKDGSKAEDIANRHASEVVHEKMWPAQSAIEVTTLQQVDPDWRAALPYGQDGLPEEYFDLTIEEIFEWWEQERRNQLQEEANKLNQLPLFMEDDNG